MIGDGYLRKVDEHWSDAEVYEVIHGAEPAFLKVSSPDAWYPAGQEAEKLSWLGGRVPSPRWWRFDEHDGREYLLTAAAAGRDLRARIVDPDDPLDASAGVCLLAAATRAVHDSLATADCPYTLSPSWLLSHSESIRAAGRADEAYCLEVTGLRVEEAFDAAHALLPGDDDDLVVVHGDTYARNLIVGDDGGWTWVDWGWLGVGHRWHDLGTAIVWLENRVDPALVDLFLDAYGIERNDPALAFFRILDGLR